MKFKRYEKSRDSGVEWLGAIPEHWDLKRVKRLFTVVNGSTPKSGEPDYWDGDIAWVTPDDLGTLSSTEILQTRRYITKAGYDSCGTTLVPKGSLVLSTRAPIGHLAIAGLDLCTNQGCRCLAFRNTLDRKYYYYQFDAARTELESWGQGSTFKELGKSHLEYIHLVEPPYPEQNDITAFLDRETAKIDALIEKKERLIELLQEKRNALITHAVTRGLNPNVPMKDSGVEWIGEIPAHWGIKRLKYFIKSGVQNGLFKKKEHFGAGTRLINVFDIYQDDFFIKETQLDRVEANETEREVYSVENGDIFFVRSSLKLEGVGKAACALQILEPAVFECHLVRVRPKEEEVLPEYLINYLNSRMILQRLVSLANTVTMSTIDQQRIASIKIAMPSLDEQERIAAYIHAKTEMIDSLVKRIREGVDRLNEYRTVLISSAVTGKIDVREEAA